MREGDRENKENEEIWLVQVREGMRGRNQAVGDGQLKLFHRQKWRTKCKGAFDGEGNERENKRKRMNPLDCQLAVLNWVFFFFLISGGKFTPLPFIN